MADLTPIIKQFPEVGEVQEVKALTSGLINQTYLVKTLDEKAPNYVLQRINNNIFCDVDMLQHNIEVVTAHIRQKLVEANEDDIERKVLRFIPATNGKTYYKDESGYWRVSVFIQDSQTLEAVTPESSYLAGLKFGEFQAMLADVPEQLGEIIPNFHNMEFRLQQLREAVADNKAGRLAEVQDIVDAIEKDAEKMCSAEQLHREGETHLPLRHQGEQHDVRYGRQSALRHRPRHHHAKLHLLGFRRFPPFSSQYRQGRRYRLEQCTVQHGNFQGFCQGLHRIGPRVPHSIGNRDVAIRRTALPIHAGSALLGRLHQR